MKIIEQQQRNEEARESIMAINKERGLRWDFIASKVDMKYHSFANWKRGAYDFGEERLSKVEYLINKYRDV